jgi:hypothetical protein
LPFPQTIEDYMSRDIFLPALAAVALLLPARSSAQMYLAPYVAHHGEADLGLGLQMGFPFPETGEQTLFVMDAGLFFPDSPRGHDAEVDYWEANANVILRFPSEDDRFTPWALGGLNLAHEAVGLNLGPFDEGERRTETKIGFNVGAGMTFGAGPLSPFAGAKVEVAGGSAVVVFGGVSFRLGLEES